MLSLGCRSIPSRVISQIHVDELLLECLNIDLTRRPLTIFPFRENSSRPPLGKKLRSVMPVTHPRGIDRLSPNHDCV
jgi:hypothetical protein